MILAVALISAMHLLPVNAENFEDAYNDVHHLNESGAKKLTHYLAQFLK